MSDTVWILWNRVEESFSSQQDDRWCRLPHFWGDVGRATCGASYGKAGSHQCAGGTLDCESRMRPSWKPHERRPDLGRKASDQTAPTWERVGPTTTSVWFQEVYIVKQIIVSGSASYKLDEVEGDGNDQLDLSNTHTHTKASGFGVRPLLMLSRWTLAIIFLMTCTSFYCIYNNIYIYRYIICCIKTPEGLALTGHCCSEERGWLALSWWAGVEWMGDWRNWFCHRKNAGARNNLVEGTADWKLL